ncbi:MAG: PEP-CTERM sorting domain-containing protein [Chthonomonas sp.]|nr:PEP-CTERM sorting domain-containing protein [Chthonomonas sp.]
MNFRNIALVAALVSVAGVASAQNISFTAAQNCAVIGDLISINQGASSFKLNVVYSGSAPISGTALMLSIAHGMNSLTGNGVTGGTNVDGKLSMVRSSQNYWNLNNAIVAATNQFAWNTAFIGFGADPGGVGAGNAYQNGLLNGGTGTSMDGGTAAYTTGRAFVSTTGANGTHSAMNMTPGLVLTQVEFTHTIAAGDVYGDSLTEAGIFMSTAGSGSTNTRNSRLGSAALSSQKYRVTAKAVPEPTTMAALGLGLAAIARRRRNKK